MLSVNERGHALELLEMVSWEDLQSLTRTVTNGIVVPLSPEEACTAILQHTSSTEELLSRQKITKEILFTYLHQKNVPFSRSDKITLKKLIIELWNKYPAPCKNAVSLHHPQKLINNAAEYENIENRELLLSKNTNESNELAYKFTEWFYMLLNRSESDTEGFLKIGPEHFFADCSIRLALKSATSCVLRDVEKDAVGVVQLIMKTKTEHNIFFNPNMTSEGVRGKTTSHGLVTVVACGTLHQGDKCAGVFEQAFGLARDPFSDNNWKIKYTEMNLKSQEFVTKLPALTDSELGRTLLALPDV